MHQILSYQTAMRAAHERDSREYITRRICISFVFSVGFFTLIAGRIYLRSDTGVDQDSLTATFLPPGFLLGKFVSDRQYLIKQMKMERDPSPIKSLELAVNSLIPVAANLTRNQSPVLHPDSNTKVWSNWKDCFLNQLQETVDYDQKPVDFTTNLVYRYLLVMKKCFQKLAYVIENIEDH